MTNKEIVSDIYAQVQKAYIDSGESNTDFLCLFGRLRHNDCDVISAYKNVRYFYNYPLYPETKSLLEKIIQQYRIPTKDELNKMKDAQIEAQVKAEQDRVHANVEECMRQHQNRKAKKNNNWGCIVIGGLAFITTFFLTMLFGNIAYTKDLAQKYLEGD